MSAVLVLCVLAVASWLALSAAGRTSRGGVEVDRFSRALRALDRAEPVSRPASRTVPQLDPTGTVRPLPATTRR